MDDKKCCGCGHEHDGLECAGIDVAQQDILEQINNGHWAVMGILADEDTLFHTFSVGLFENYDHPEIIVFGIHPHVATKIINEIGERITDGLKLEAGRVYDEIVQRYGVVFIPVEKEMYSAYMNAARWYYRGDDFPVLQMVWPDPNRKFPWEEGFDTRYEPGQPLLGFVPNNAAEPHGQVVTQDKSEQDNPDSDAE